MQLLNSFGLTLVTFIFVLGFLIFIHELGHYMVAKYLGIRVEVFSLGFGKRLFGFRRGDTDYRVSLIPLGGYVKMTGENPNEELAGGPEEFLSRPKRHRFAVAVAGPLMNIGLAVLLLMFSFMSGTRSFAYLSEAPVVGAVDSDSPAAAVGIQPGDQILTIDGEEMADWDDVQFKVATSPDIQLQMELQREGRVLVKTIIPAIEDPEIGAGTIGVRPFIPYVVSEVEPNSPAERAGLLGDDEILSMSDESGSYSGFYQILDVVQRGGTEPLDFQIRRGDRQLTLTIAPEMNEGIPRIGAYVVIPTKSTQYGPWAAFQQSVSENWRITKLVGVTVGRLVTGRASIKQMSGPIDIAKYSGRAASLGWQALATFMALVSLQLGLLNLLPIPVLDGGLIMLLGVEAVLGRELSLEAKERIFHIGFIFIVLLMGVVLLNDIAKNLPF